MFRELAGNGCPRIVRVQDVVKQIPLDLFCQVTQQFGELRSMLNVRVGTPEAAELMNERTRTSVYLLCDAALNSPVIRYLPHFAQALVRLRALTEHPQTAHTYEVAEHLSDAVRRMVDETAGAAYMLLEPELTGFGASPFAGWEKSIGEFPLIKPDVQEASLCLVFERPTAAVFHLMRVMEFGLDKLRQMVRVPRKRAGWDGIIEAIDAQLKPKPGAKKSAATRKRHRYIAEAVLSLRAVKESRNTAMHDWTKSYTMTQAIDQYRSVKNFMEKMADAV